MNFLGENTQGSIANGGTITGTLTINDVPENYTFPSTQANAAGQVLIDSAGDGQLVWGTTAGSGDVVGPNLATNKAVCRFNEISGTLIQNSSVSIDDTGNITSSGVLNLGPLIYPNVVGAAGEVLTDELGDGVLSFKPPVDPPVFGEIYFQNNMTPTVITTIGMYVPIVGPFILGNSQNFNLFGNGLQAKKAGVFGFVGTFAVDRVANGDDDFYFAFYKNGAIIQNSEMIYNVLGKDGDTPHSVNLTAIITCALDDIITVWVANKQSTTDIIICCANIISLPVVASGVAAVEMAGGDVFGPNAATNNALCRFDLPSGKLIKNSVAVLDDAGVLTLGNVVYPSVKGTIGQILVDSAGDGILAFEDQAAVNPLLIANPSATNSDNALCVWDGTDSLSVKNSLITLTGDTFANNASGMIMNGSSTVLLGDTVRLFVDGSDALLADSFGLKIGPSASGYQIPYSRGSDGQVLKTDAAGVATWQTIAGGIVAPVSTLQNSLAVWGDTVGGNLNDSVFTINTNTLSANTSSMSLTPTSVSFLRGLSQKMEIKDDEITASVPILVEDGTSFQPSVAFSSETTTGVYMANANDMRMSVAGVDCFQFSGNGGVATAPLDAVLTEYSSACSLAVSVRRLLSTYPVNGNCMDIEDSSGVPITATLLFDNNGQVDKTQYDFLGLTLPVYITKFYDQSGNGNDLLGLAGVVVAPPTPERPKLIWELMLSGLYRPTVVFSNSRFQSTVGVDVLQLSGPDHAMGMVTRQLTGANIGDRLCSAEGVVDGINQSLLNGGGDAFRAIDDGAGNAPIGAPDEYNDDNYHQMAMGFRNGTQMCARHNGVQGLSATGLSQTATTEKQSWGYRPWNDSRDYTGHLPEIFILTDAWIENSGPWTTYWQKTLDYFNGGLTLLAPIAKSFGNFSINDYTLPVAKGSTNQVLNTDGVGGCSWADISQNLKWTTVSNVVETDTLGEFPLLNAGVGSKLVADSSIGTRIHLRISGHLKLESGNTFDLFPRISTINFSTLQINSAYDDGFTINISFTVRAIGASLTTIQCNGEMSTTGQSRFLSNENTTIPNTNPLDIGAFGEMSAVVGGSNIFTVNQASINIYSI